MRTARFGLVALLLALALPAPASADVVSTTDTGGVSARGLTAAERRALDVDTVTAIGSEAGLFVEVDLKGNTERRLGRGHLRRAMAAIILVPRDSSTTPSVLATRGRGPVGQTLRRTRTEEVLVTRDGDSLAFTVLGGGLEDVERVEVRTYVRGQLTGATTAQGGLDQLVRNPRVADQASLRAPNPGEDPCRSVRALLREKEAELSRARVDQGAADERVMQIEERIEKNATKLERNRDPARGQRLRENIRKLSSAQGEAAANSARLRIVIIVLQDQIIDLRRVEARVCGRTAPTGTLEIFGRDHGSQGYGNVCVNADTNMSSGTATLTLQGTPGSVQEPATQTVQLDANGNAAAIWRVVDPDATYTVSGRAEGNLGTVEFEPKSLNFTNVNSENRTCGPR